MTLLIFSSAEELAETAAEMIGGLLEAAAAARGIAHFALSGGGTPRPVYAALGRPPLAGQIPWEQVHFWWADERCIPPTDPESNYHLAVETLLGRIAVPAGNVHRVLGELSPAAAATAYATELQAAAGGALWPRFDVALLGMGADGHTASLFPGSDPGAGLTRPVLAVTADYEGRPANRVTLTPAVLNAAREILVVVTGAKKAETLAAVLDDSAPGDFPIRRIQPGDGTLTWLVDRAAAGRLP